jgi:hypothetical protein
VIGSKFVRLEPDATFVPLQSWRPASARWARHAWITLLSYESQPLLPGEFYVAALESIELGQSMDPEFIESLRSRATRVTVGRGTTTMRVETIAA